MSVEKKTVLVIEDGDEYLENLSRFVPDFRYAQVHTGKEAIEYLKREKVDVVYLDMRFDRISEEDLLGDHESVTIDHNGDQVKAWRFLMNNQGLFILAALKEENLDGIPIILAYDFTREKRRFAHLGKIYPSLKWVPDDVTPDRIDSLLKNL